MSNEATESDDDGRNGGSGARTEASEEDEASFRAYRTVVEMLRDRGYTVRRRYRLGRPEELMRIRKKRELVLKASDALGDTVHVYFPHESKLCVKTVRKYVEAMQKADVHHAVVVVGDDVTPFTRGALEAMKPEWRFEVFDRKSMERNITHHRLYKTHTPLSEVEKAALLKQYHATGKMVSLLYSTDPVARYFGWPAGTVVRIRRVLGTLEPYYAYRIVV